MLGEESGKRATFPRPKSRIISPRQAGRLVMTEVIPASIQSGAWVMRDTRCLTRDRREIPVSMSGARARAADGEVRFFSTIMQAI